MSNISPVKLFIDENEQKSENQYEAFLIIFLEYSDKICHIAANL